MGYCITFVDAKFRIPAAKVTEALVAVVALGIGQNDSRAAGGVWTASGKTIHHYSWLNNADPSTWVTIDKVFKAWRFPVEMGPDGGVVDIDFSGEKIGQENIFFDVVAPFVEAGSYIEMRGEDGQQWRWVFDGSTCREVQATVSFDRDDAYGSDVADGEE